MANKYFFRELTYEERTALWKQLKERWGADGECWYPLRTDPMPSNVIAFKIDWFFYQFPMHLLPQILKKHGVTRVWELREYPPYEYEIDCELLVPSSSEAERYWTSGEMDWLIYTSHEDSLTIAGEWLIQEIKEVWPEWNKHLFDFTFYNELPDEYDRIKFLDRIRHEIVGDEPLIPE